MKRFWLSLLSLGLVMAFSVSAFAVDVKVGAEYYAAGIYLSETSLAKDTPTHSTAFYYQRLRVGTDFVVSPCLSLVTRFDAMERIWGGIRTPNPSEADEQSAGTRRENENIAFDLAYIKYVSPIGLFEVGYQKDYEWGTIFDNRTTGPTVGTITYGVPVGPVNVVFQYAKESDLSSSAVTFADTTDLDYDSYRLGAVYNFKNGEAGALLLFNRLATYKDGSPLPGNVAFLADVYKVIPYFKAQIGPVALQGEFEYTFGKAKIEEPYSSGVDDISIGAWSAFLDATANFGMFYAGGSFVYLSGDDPATDKIEGGSFAGVGINTAGLDWNPCLILFNNDFRYWAGSIWGHSDSYVNSEMQNALFFQGRVGVKPNPKTDIMLSISYATADEKPAPFANMGYGDPTVYGNGDYGWEIDLTGTYKITNNLTYMLGAGYLFTGDYFKGFDYDGADMDTNNEYMLINKLTLSF